MDRILNSITVKANMKFCEGVAMGRVEYHCLLFEKLQIQEFHYGNFLCSD